MSGQLNTDVSNVFQLKDETTSNQGLHISENTSWRNRIATTTTPTQIVLAADRRGYGLRCSKPRQSDQKPETLSASKSTHRAIITPGLQVPSPILRNSRHLNKQLTADNTGGFGGGSHLVQGRRGVFNRRDADVGDIEFDNEAFMAQVLTAKVCCKCSDGRLITSANANFIPKFPVESADFLVRKDGHFGLYGAHSHPQLQHAEFMWSSTILRKPDNPKSHKHSILWRDFDPGDFRRTPNSNNIGRLHSSDLQHMQQELLHIKELTDRDDCQSPVSSSGSTAEYMDSLRSILFGLLNEAASWNITMRRITAFQRFALDILGILKYRELKRSLWTAKGEKPSHALDPTLMGAFVQSLEDAYQLHRIGVYCWLIHNSTVHTNTLSVVPRNVLPVDTFGVCHDRWTGQDGKPLSVSLGWAGPGWKRQMLARMFHPLSEVIDYCKPHSPHPSPTRSNKMNLPKLSSSNKHIFGSNFRLNSASLYEQRRRDDLVKRFMPILDGSWAAAFDQIDDKQDCRPVVEWFDLDNGRGGVMLPPIHLWVGMATEEKRQEYTRTWLSVSQSLLVKLARSTEIGCRHPSMTQWRDLLSLGIATTTSANQGTTTNWRFSTKTGHMSAIDCREDIKRQFGISMHDVNVSPFVEFVGRKYALHEVDKLTDNELKRVLWCLNEQMFRFQLRDLHVLQTTGSKEEHPSDLLGEVNSLFPDNSTLVTQSPTVELPDSGLNDLDTSARHLFVFRLAALMRRWHYVPPSISKVPAVPSGDVDTDALHEAVILQHYCQAYYHTYAKPPAIPRRLISTP